MKDTDREVFLDIPGIANDTSSVTKPKFADIHVHTVYSDGWWRLPKLAASAVQIGLSAIAVTDHDDCSAGLALANFCHHNNIALDVVVGAEISAHEDGEDIHVIGLGLNANIRPFMPLADTVDAILAQGGVPVIPHPVELEAGRPSFEDILALETPVAVEVYNASMSDLDHKIPGRAANARNDAARAFYVAHQQQLLGAVGGTDAHFRTVGRGLTGYRGNLLTSIRDSQTMACYRDANETLKPGDLIGYLQGLRRMDRRRRVRWNLE